MGGGSLSGDVWISKQSKFYHGCSDSSNSFPSGCILFVLPHLSNFCMIPDTVTFAAAEVNTHPNRYLMIATSGGLNQQRTGVNIFFYPNSRAQSLIENNLYPLVVVYVVAKFSMERYVLCV